MCGVRKPEFHVFLRFESKLYHESVAEHIRGCETEAGDEKVKAETATMRRNISC